jgi:undecaprenyl-diphosphatase
MDFSFIVNLLRDTVIAAIFGVVQGITEFLPISSSGHLVVLHNWFSLPIASGLGFDVALHFASFLAVLWYFRARVLELILGWIETIQGKKSVDGKLAWYILLATIPAAIIGYFFDDIIENQLRSVLIVAVALFIGAVLFLLVERYAKLKFDLKGINWQKALMIGLAQALALIPGTSRSGITIIAGLSLGLKRGEAVRFSFLLALPVLFGAGIKQLTPLIRSGVSLYESYLIVVAAWAALLSSWWAVGYLLSFVKTNNFKPFAYYRIGLAILVLLTLLLF